jgi:hypothetical protein
MGWASGNSARRDPRIKKTSLSFSFFSSFFFYTSFSCNKMKLTSLFFVSSLFITAQAGIFSHRAADSDASTLDNTNDKDSKPGVVDKKLDYKLTFKVPYLYNGTIPFWSTGGGKLP